MIQLSFHRAPSYSFARNLSPPSSLFLKFSSLANSMVNKMAAATPRLSHSRRAKNRSDTIFLKILTSLFVSEETDVYFYYSSSVIQGDPREPDICKINSTQLFFK